MEALSAIVTIVAFLFAVGTWVIAQRRQDRDAAQIVVVQQQIRNARRQLGSTFQLVNEIVQVAKAPEVTILELQALARLARSQVVAVAQVLDESDDLFALWETTRIVKRIQSAATTSAPTGSSAEGDDAGKLG